MPHAKQTIRYRPNPSAADAMDTPMKPPGSSRTRRLAHLLLIGHLFLIPLLSGFIWTGGISPLAL